MSVFDAGSVRIVDDEITLTKFGGGEKLNIFNFVSSFDVFESLENYTVSADFYLADGIDLVNEFPIGGEELITVSFETPSRKTITYEFFVHRVLNQRANDMSNSRSYILQCVTKDFLSNSFKTFTKRYKDRKYDESVYDVIQGELGSSKQLFVEKTKGEFDYVVNHVRPFQVIDLLKERAVSADFKSSMFYFYEDNQGYNFITLEKLIHDRKGAADNFVFTLDTSQRVDDVEKRINFRNIIAYEVNKQGSSIDKVRAGDMRRKVYQFDLLTGLYAKNDEYINTTDYQQYETIDSGKDFNSAAYNSFVTQKPAVQSMLFLDSTRPEMKHNDSVHFKRPFFSKVHQYGVTIRVYGDTDLRVGDVVKLEVPAISGVDNPKQQEVFSENYIVYEMKHMLYQQENYGFQHYMVLDLRKPNMFGDIG